MTGVRITTVPVLLGSGVPLFGGVTRDARLQHVQTRTCPGGLVQSEHRVASSHGTRREPAAQRLTERGVDSSPWDS